MSQRSLAVVAMGLLGACEPEPEDQMVELDDVGQACLGGMEGPSVDVEEDEPVTVVVTLEGCASGCAGEIEASCTAIEDGGTISVRATASYIVPGGALTCPAVCLFVQAECDTSALVAGSYALEYAGDSVSFDVPSTATGVCAGTYN